MATLRPPSHSEGNFLLARLPRPDRERLLPHLATEALERDQTLYETHAPIRYSYFPITAVASSLTVMSDGAAIEVATVGREGGLGMPSYFDAETSPNRVIVQVAGDALRMESEVLRREVSQDGPFRRLLIRYHTAYQTQVSQSVACNGLHVVQQRCCRWLLMTRDRVESDDVPLTHEYLAMMLGVRRPSVTEVLHPLQERGLIANRRGKIRILDPEGLKAVCCECYQAVNAEYERLLGPLPRA